MFPSIPKERNRNAALWHVYATTRSAIKQETMSSSGPTLQSVAPLSTFEPWCFIGTKLGNDAQGVEESKLDVGMIPGNSKIVVVGVQVQKKKQISHVDFWDAILHSLPLQTEFGWFQSCLKMARFCWFLSILLSKLRMCHWRRGCREVLDSKR